MAAPWTNNREEDGAQLNRRAFVRGAVLGGIGAALPTNAQAWAGGNQAHNARPVQGVVLELNRIHKWDQSNGDTWDPFWADDDALYAFNCDGRGFGQTAMNLACNRLSGSSPDTLTGAQVNSMADYGRANERGPDHATWKACGQECIDGVFYAFVSRNTYGDEGGDPLLRQTARNASLIRSHDRGRTWTRSAQQNDADPMWPGAAFGAPFFVHYGRNGGHVLQDGAVEFVYACSTNGFWNDGDHLILGRVRRTRLPHLNPADWEYYAGGDGNTAAAWRREILQAQPILSRAAMCGQTPITFIPALGIYLLISWYNTAKMTQWFKPNRMRYDFYQATHPWGPWSQVASHDDRFLGPGVHMYGPSLCARFQQQREDGVEVSLFTSGCPFDDVKDGPYKIWRIPVLLCTRRLPASETILGSDDRIQYRGAWFPQVTTEVGDLRTAPRATFVRGAAAEMTFTGTGVEYLADKSSGQGSAAVLLDGVRVETVSLQVSDFSRLLAISVYSNHRLSRRKHTIRIVNDGDAPINIVGFRVFC